MKAKQIPAAVRQALAERSGSVCEKCGTARAEQAHHRRPRAMGGSRRGDTNTLPNLLHLCAACHLWIESNRSLAFTAGWLVPQSMLPTHVPLFYRDYEMPVFLREDGSIEVATDSMLIGLMPLGYGYPPNSEDMGGEVA
jgi:5-methylcytosine-specific restriction protein A